MRKSILVLIIVSIILSGTSVAFSDSRAVKSRPAVVRKGDSVLLSSGDISKQKSGWKELESKLKARTGDFNGEVGVYIKDLQNGWEISINGEHKIPSASLVKIPIMVS